MEKQSKYIESVLQVLHELGGSATSQEITEAVILKNNISDEELNIKTKNGISVVKNLIAWAKVNLQKSQDIFKTSTGVYVLSNASHKPSNECRLMPDEYSTDTQSIKEILILELNSISPKGFERLIQRILREYGFDKVIVTGRSSDGGIDGEGYYHLNPFISMKVVFQCKRYKNNISSPMIRDFRGAMQGKADNGIFITTSSFTKDAYKEGSRDGVYPIKLIDGSNLVDIMLDLKIGILNDNQIDSDFFNEFK